MSKHINSPADVQPECGAPEMNPAGSGRTSAPAGIFSMRRERYFNDEAGLEAGLDGGLDEKGRGMSHAKVAGLTVTKTTEQAKPAESDQAGGIA
jgi:hypothetical protein